jgi:hypothetical protein
MQLLAPGFFHFFLPNLELLFSPFYKSIAANRNNCLKMQGKGWLDSPSNSSVLVFDSTKDGRSKPNEERMLKTFTC